MKKIKLFAIIMSTIVIAACTQGENTLNKTADNKIDSILNVDKHVGLAVVVVKNNEIVYSNQFGWKNIEEKSKISEDDIFRIASISKTFTSTAIMQLCEQGKFLLDDDVSNALGFIVRNPNFPEIPITYRMLLSHTSSLSDRQGYFTFDVLKSEKNENYKDVYWSYAPGTKYNYCNLGYNLLGALVEIHSGIRFDKYIEKNILNPLGITKAGFNVDELDKSKFVPLYVWSDSARNWIESKEAYISRNKEISEYKLGESTTLFSPTGGMKISAIDLAKWLICRMNDGKIGNTQIISKHSAEIMNVPLASVEYGESYGLGLMITTNLVNGKLLIGHTGDAYGLKSAMFFNPETGFGIVMLTNGCIEEKTDGETKIIWDVVNEMFNIFAGNAELK